MIEFQKHKLFKKLKGRPLICTACNSKYEMGDSYCFQCGRRIKYKTCQKCNTKNLPNDKYCYSCGKKLWFFSFKLKLINRKPLAIGLSLFLILLLLASTISGYAGQLLNIYPPIGVVQKTTTLKCNFKSNNVIIDIDLYGNYYNYYKYNARKNEFTKSGDYSLFVYENSSDETINRLVNKIQREGTRLRLSSDQVLELASCLVQNIPYDDVKSKMVLNGSGNNTKTEQFPYETLYVNKGICTDKAYLASIIIKKLGYGTGLLSFPEDYHLTLGIKAPTEYADFGRYTILDVTKPGFRPGLLPTTIEDNTGKPVSNITQIVKLNKNAKPSEFSIAEQSSLAAPTRIIDVNDGKEYTRIVTIKKNEEAISKNLSELNELKNKMSDYYNEVEYWERQVTSAKNRYLLEPISKYECGYVYEWDWYSRSYEYNYKCNYKANSWNTFYYNLYLGALRNYNRYISIYNSYVDDFNIKLDEYNNLVEMYNSYEY